MGAKTELEGAVISGSKPKDKAPKARMRLGVHKRLALLIAGCIVILVLVAGGTAYVVHHTHEKNKAAVAAAQKKKAKATATPALPASQAADFAATNGQYDAAQQILSAAIKKTKDKKTQATLYSQQSSIALNAQKYADATTYALAADKAAPTYATAGLLGNVYMAAGDKTSAKSEFQTAISRLDSKSDTYGRQLNELQSDLQGASQ